MDWENIIAGDTVCNDLIVCSMDEILTENVNSHTGANNLLDVFLPTTIYSNCWRKTKKLVIIK